MCSNGLKSTYICRCEGCEKHSNKEGKMKKKNKWYEVLGAGLLSVSAMYLCTSLVVTGCSVDDGSLDALDANETSEVVESGSDEEVESSEAEKSSKPEETSKEEAEASESEEQEPAEAEENTEAEETADAEEKPTTTPETEEPAESGDETAPEESTEPEESAEPAEPAEPAETTEPAEEKTEQAEPSNSEEKIEPIESAEPESVELNNAKEWEIIRDSITAVVENNSIQYLYESRFLKVERSDKSSRFDEYRMDREEFIADYQYDGYDQHLTDRLYEDEILWEGFNWTNLNKPECRFKAELDSVLTHGVWPEDLVEMEAVYSVRYVCQSLGLEGNVFISIPVRYRAKQD